MVRAASTLAIGAAAGVLFFAHGMINNSHAWPLVWPLLGGVAAVVAARRRGGSGPWRAIGQGAFAGVLAGGVFLAFTSVALFTLYSTGAGGDLGWRVSAFKVETLVALAVVAAIGVLAALAGGMAAAPLVRRPA
jgi:hypothetical protein